MMTARGLRVALLGKKQASRDRLYAEHSKEVGRDRRALDSFQVLQSVRLRLAR